GFLMYRDIEGDFLAIADVSHLSSGIDDGIPPGDQSSGIGILARDPRSALKDAHQVFVAIDRGTDLSIATGPAPAVHGGWSNGMEGPVSTSGRAQQSTGKIALCRYMDHFSVWSKEGALPWADRSIDLILTMPDPLEAPLPQSLQVGIY